MSLNNQQSVASIKPLWCSFIRLMVLILAFGLYSNVVNAAIDVLEFDTPKQEEQYRHLIDEFRCPKCQNQNLAGSDSVIAEDLKRKTYDMVKAGKTDAQIRDYMQERYGDFISYKPPVRPSTWILWFFPPLFLIGLIGWWLWHNARLNHSTMLQVNSAATRSSAVTASDKLAVSDVHDTHPSDIMASDKIGSDLSAKETEALNALLNEYDTNSDSNSSNL